MSENKSILFQPKKLEHVVTRNPIFPLKTQTQRVDFHDTYVCGLPTTRREDVMSTWHISLPFQNFENCCYEEKTY